MWKDIIGFEDRYEISDTGEIRNKNTKNLLHLKLDRDGYHQIGIRKKSERKKYWFYIHRLVALHFLENSNEMLNQVDHIDRNKLNNNVSNLRWVTCGDNNMNRKMLAWNSNKTTGELYITKYKNGYMLRINRKNYKKRNWFTDLETAITHRNACLEEIKQLDPAC